MGSQELKQTTLSLEKRLRAFEHKERVLLARDSLQAAVSSSSPHEVSSERPELDDTRATEVVLAERRQYLARRDAKARDYFDNVLSPCPSKRERS
jgi:hypothetical protein